MLNAKVSQPTIFIVDDDGDVAKVLGPRLEEAGYRTRAFSSGATIISAAEKETPSLFLLDMTVNERVLEFCREIRSNVSVGTPIILVGPESSEQERIATLEAGADDYVTKPFSWRELLARVRALQRRFDMESRAWLRAGDLEVDPATMMVVSFGRVVPVTAAEFRLLEFFMRNAGRVFSRQQLIESVQQPGSQDVSLRAVDVSVRRLRARIERNPKEPKFVKTVRGIGYRFDNPSRGIPGEARAPRSYSEAESGIK